MPDEEKPDDEPFVTDKKLVEGPKAAERKVFEKATSEIEDAEESQHVDVSEFFGSPKKKRPPK